MRILLDESLPTDLAGELGLPLLKTVAQLGLKGFTNGDLLRRAEVLGIEVLITADQNLEFQQHIPGYALGVIVLRARSNRMEDLRPRVPAIHQALTLIGPGHVIHLGSQSNL
ncbi:MAG TPA: hypothetical protein VGS57_03325 [Thermoanaerobaculia bacterium]|nr:hypothetical protein [Thermoanaerobaculia bacterium]